jgi:hypothetical protein
MRAAALLRQQLCKLRVKDFRHTRRCAPSPKT